LNLSSTLLCWEMFGHQEVHILYFWNLIKGNHLEKKSNKEKGYRGRPTAAMQLSA
jgi:hypothetical protein